MSHLASNEEIVSSGFMVAVMALMEIPAIVIALFLYRRSNNGNCGKTTDEIPVFAAKSVVLLLGVFVIGQLLTSSSA